MTATPLTAGESAALAALLDVVIPPDAARGLPGASETGFDRYMREHDVAAFVRGGIAGLASGFATLPADAKADAVRSLERADPMFFRAFMRHVVQCYYQHDRVLRAVGVEPRAPFPEGFRIDDGDLTLLEPVAERGQLYRS